MKITIRIFSLAIFLFIIQSCGIFRFSAGKTEFSKREVGPADYVTSDTVITDTALRQADTLAIIRDTVVMADTIMKPDSLSIVMIGDVMLGTNYPKESYLPPDNNCHPLLEPFIPLLAEADISFCNLEGTFAGEHGVAKSCKNPENCYVFRMPDDYVECITAAGFDLIGVANNHVNDFGLAGRINTAKVLEEAGLIFAGFIDKPFAIFEKDGLMLGFCAFAPHSGVADMRNYEQAKTIVGFLNDTCDIVIVSVHAGAEGRNYQHVTRKTEMFLEANRGNIYDFAHTMVDAGADVIIGHGPHVTRGMEVYRNRFIAYSLGNFATYARFNLSGPNGIAPLVKIYTDHEGTFLSGKIFAAMQTGEGGAKPDPLNRVIYTIRDLNSIDFPDNLLNIDDEGNIFPAN